MEPMITHPQPGDAANAPLPVPPPERLRQIFAFTDMLFDSYGPDRSTWPHLDEWPWHLLDGAR
jgi:hypothetical protein